MPLHLVKPVQEGQENFQATAMNISLNGVYCTVNRYFPIFDRLLLTFVSAENETTDTPPASDPFVVQCEGIVVRVEPEEEDPARTEYNVAVYFAELTPDERDVLHAIIVSHS
jgi:hypothetical protein